MSIAATSNAGIGIEPDTARPAEFGTTRPIDPRAPVVAGAQPGPLPAPASILATGVSTGVLTDLALRLMLRDPLASTDTLARRMALLNTRSNSDSA